MKLNPQLQPMPTNSSPNSQISMPHDKSIHMSTSLQVPRTLTHFFLGIVVLCMCCVPYERVENGERQTDGLGKGLENAIYLRLLKSAMRE
jgi:hypothetical protein